MVPDTGLCLMSVSIQRLWRSKAMRMEAISSLEFQECFSLANVFTGGSDFNASGSCTPPSVGSTFEEVFASSNVPRLFLSEVAVEVVP